MATSPRTQARWLIAGMSVVLAIAVLMFVATLRSREAAPAGSSPATTTTVDDRWQATAEPPVVAPGGLVTITPGGEIEFVCLFLVTVLDESGAVVAILNRTEYSPVAHGVPPTYPPCQNLEPSGAHTYEVPAGMPPGRYAFCIDWDRSPAGCAAVTVEGSPVTR